MTTREEMQERIEKAMARYEEGQRRNKQKKRGRKRKGVKLFSVDRYEPRREQAIAESYEKLNSE